MNISDFAYDGEGRDNIRTPWSRGLYSYATNGHVLVRISRLLEIPERRDAPNGERVLVMATTRMGYQPLLVNVALPAPTVDTCLACEGEGSLGGEVCDFCDGAKVSTTTNAITVQGVAFDPKYISQIAALPAPEMAINHNMKEPHPFRFSGGIGCLMAMSIDPSKLPRLKPNGSLDYPS